MDKWHFIPIDISYSSRFKTSKGGYASPFTLQSVKRINEIKFKDRPGVDPIEDQTPPGHTLQDSHPTARNSPGQFRPDGETASAPFPFAAELGTGKRLGVVPRAGALLGVMTACRRGVIAR